MLKKCVGGLFALLLGLISQAVFAEGVDVSTVVTGISSSGASILIVIGALLGLSVSVLGIVKVHKFIERRAGA